MRKCCVCFVDYQKAFDSINHEKLMRIMEMAGIPVLVVWIENREAYED